MLIANWLIRTRFLEANLQWLIDKITNFIKDEPTYILFDCPGQVELFTNNNSLKNIITRLTKELDLRICVVNLCVFLFYDSLNF